MTTLRSHFVWALMALTLAIMGPFYVVWNLFTPGGYRSYPMSVLWIKICTLWMGLKIRATGRENLPPAGTCILMPNHRSWWDIPTVQIGAYPHQVRFVAKKELGKLPLLGTCMIGGGHVLIDRNDRESAVRTLRDAAARYKGKISLVLFPEGTRSPGHHLLRFKRGGFHLARELGLSIVPVSVSGGEGIMKKGSLTIMPGTMCVHYHAPIPVPPDANLNAISAAVRERIAAGLQEMGEYEEAPPPKGPGAAAGPGAVLSLALATAFLATIVGALVNGPAHGMYPPKFRVHAWLGARSVERVMADSLGRSAGEILKLDPIARRLWPPGHGELSLVAAIKEDPVRAPTVLGAIGMTLLAASGAADGSLSALAASHQGGTVDLAPIEAVEARLRNTPSGPAGPLAEAIGTFYGGGKRLSGNQRDELRRTVPTVPAEVARIAADLLVARGEAARLHEEAFKNAKLARERLDRKDFDLDVMTWVDSLGEVPDRVEEVLLRAAADVDWDRLNAGAVILDRAGGQAALALSDLSTEAHSWTGRFVWDTPAGRIAIGGTGADEYRGSHLLILDIGGDDTYIGAGGARFPSRPISILIDREGNDRYAPADSSGPGVGGALGGYALVIDMGGDDEWRSYRLGLGAAIFGAGMLHDGGGDDTYVSHEFGQGAAAWGIGVLNDTRGVDRYRIHRVGQGFGGPGGVGLLVDRGIAEDDSGDVYEVDETFGVEPISRLRTPSFVQGVGMGIQRISPGAPRLAGGIGFLVDGYGDDRFLAGSMAQGAATLDGLGGLFNYSGNDTYESTGHALAFGVDGGVGLLSDALGIDRYRASLASAGIGVNLGVGVFLDGQGDDDYRMAGGQPGRGLLRGLGIFIEERGFDSYDLATSGEFEVYVRRFPSRNDLQVLRSTGLFLDLEGEDVYRTPDVHVGNRRRWGTPNADIRLGASISIGLDVNGLPPE